jgi:hypothetical protein
MDKKLDAAGEAILEAVRKNLALMPKNADVFTYDPYTEWYLPGAIPKTNGQNLKAVDKLQNISSKLKHLRGRRDQHK